MKYHLLEILLSLVPKKKKLAEFFVDVKYTYDVDVRFLNDIIAHNDYGKIIGNN